jgi:hypothetical protein
LFTSSPLGSGGSKAFFHRVANLRYHALIEDAGEEYSAHAPYSEERKEIGTRVLQGLKKGTRILQLRKEHQPDDEEGKADTKLKNFNLLDDVAMRSKVMNDLSLWKRKSIEDRKRKGVETMDHHLSKRNKMLHDFGMRQGLCNSVPSMPAMPSTPRLPTKGYYNSIASPNYGPLPLMEPVMSRPRPGSMRPCKNNSLPSPNFGGQMNMEQMMSRSTPRPRSMGLRNSFPSSNYGAHMEPMMSRQPCLTKMTMPQMAHMEPMMSRQPCLTKMNMSPMVAPAQQSLGGSIQYYTYQAPPVRVYTYQAPPVLMSALPPNLSFMDTMTLMRQAELERCATFR